MNIGEDDGVKVYIDFSISLLSCCDLWLMSSKIMSTVANIKTINCINNDKQQQKQLLLQYITANRELPNLSYTSEGGMATSHDSDSIRTHQR